MRVTGIRSKKISRVLIRRAGDEAVKDRRLEDVEGEMSLVDVFDTLGDLAEEIKSFGDS